MILHEQGGNCIVGAISNLMWHWSINGYSNLANGMTFEGVEAEIDRLINSHGGYANVIFRQLSRIMSRVRIIVILLL